MQRNNLQTDIGIGAGQRRREESADDYRGL